MRSMAAVSASRSSVGGCTSVAVAANTTMPILVFGEASATNCLAAFCIATRRLGSTSFARMEPEASSAMMMVCFCVGSVTVAVGLATATIIAASAMNISAGGTWRRMRGPAPIASLTMPRLA
jgi:hypothetical protein